METNLTQPELTKVSEMNQEELSGVIVDLIYKDSKIQKAIVDLVYSLPNIVTEL